MVVVVGREGKGDVYRSLLLRQQRQERYEYCPQTDGCRQTEELSIADPISIIQSAPDAIEDSSNHTSQPSSSSLDLHHRANLVATPPRAYDKKTRGLGIALLC